MKLVKGVPVSNSDRHLRDFPGGARPRVRMLSDDRPMPLRTFEARSGQVRSR